MQLFEVVCSCLQLFAFVCVSLQSRAVTCSHFAVILQSFCSYFALFCRYLLLFVIQKKLEIATSFMKSNSDYDLNICDSDDEHSSGYSDVDGTDLDFGMYFFINNVARCNECGESVKTFQVSSKNMVYLVIWQSRVLAISATGKELFVRATLLRKHLMRITKWWKANDLKKLRNADNTWGRFENDLLTDKNTEVPLLELSVKYILYVHLILLQYCVERWSEYHHRFSWKSPQSFRDCSESKPLYRMNLFSYSLKIVYHFQKNTSHLIDFINSVFLYFVCYHQSTNKKDWYCLVKEPAWVYNMVMPRLLITRKIALLFNSFIP